MGILPFVVMRNDLALDELADRGPERLMVLAVHRAPHAAVSVNGRSSVRRDRQQLLRTREAHADPLAAVQAHPEPAGGRQGGPVPAHPYAASALARGAVGQDQPAGDERLV